jgi:hypothetical protein
VLKHDRKNKDNDRITDEVNVENERLRNGQK